MTSYYDAIKGYLKPKKGEPCWIDSLSFRLHYKVTFILLLFLAAVATLQFAGSPIDCFVDIAIDAKVMNTYCWISSTYTLPDRLGHLIGSEVVAPGVGSRRSSSEPVQYHKYYQWVVFALIFQALLFYVPHYIWKSWENGRLRMLMKNLNSRDLRKNSAILEDIGITSQFLSTGNRNGKRTRTTNNTYMIVYTICETLNLVNVISQIFFIDMFLGYEFTTYGTKVFEFLDKDSSERIDPMEKIFPKMSKCTLHLYGPSGNIVPYDGLCVLALNIINEKIYIFLWFWLILLAVLTGIGFMKRMATILLPFFRVSLLKKKVVENHNSFLNPSKESAIDIIMGRITLGDWFMLNQLGKSMRPDNFWILIRALAYKYGWREPKTE